MTEQNEHSDTPAPEPHLAALEKEIKDLKHDLASAEGRAKNATSNCDYWKDQYEVLAKGTRSPEKNVSAMEAPWQWWAGSTEEWCTVGPENTREAIIQAATNDSLGEFQHEEGGWNLGFHIVEARSDPLRLADWIESDQLLERAEESMADSDRTSSENDDGPWFECTQEQGKDLEERIKRACDEWQAAHGLKFACSTFSHTRNQEHVVVELPDDTATTEGQPDA